jgi:hypothetical protein
MPLSLGQGYTVAERRVGLRRGQSGRSRLGSFCLVRSGWVRWGVVWRSRYGAVRSGLVGSGRSRFGGLGMSRTAGLGRVSHGELRLGKFCRSRAVWYGTASSVPLRFGWAVLALQVALSYRVLCFGEVWRGGRGALSRGLLEHGPLSFGGRGLARFRTVSLGEAVAERCLGSCYG